MHREGKEKNDLLNQVRSKLGIYVESINEIRNFLQKEVSNFKKENVPNNFYEWMKIILNQESLKQL